MNHWNRNITFLSIFCLSVVLTVVLLNSKKVSLQTQAGVSAASSRSDSRDKKEDMNREGTGEYPVELTYSDCLSFPGRSKSHYADRTPIEVKIADENIFYFIVTVQEGYLSGSDRENAKDLLFYASSASDLSYAVCNNGKSAPFLEDAIQFRFYDSDKNLRCSRTVSVLYSEDTGDFFLSDIGRESLPEQSGIQQDS